MNLTLTATPELVLIDGVRCRIYKGRTFAGGVAVNVYVHHIAPIFGRDVEEFEKEISIKMPPASEPVPMTLTGTFVKPTIEETA